MSSTAHRNAPAPHGTDTLTYAEYLCLDRLLDSQRHRAEPFQHDELVFIIFHQVTELWFKLILHELDAARLRLRADLEQSSLEALRRSHETLVQLVDQWSIMDTLTPAAFERIRPALGNASGLYSAQYRELESLLGRRKRPSANGGQTDSTRSEHWTTRPPSLFDEFLRHLHRRGHPIPRYYTAPSRANRRRPLPELSHTLQHIYDNPKRYQSEFLLCDELAKIDEALRAWRRKHLLTVARLIGDQRGTGGTSGVRYLSAGVDRLYYPELAKAAKASRARFSRSQNCDTRKQRRQKD